MDEALAELKDRLGQLTDLRRTEGLLVWDMTVFMPPGGAPTRAAQLATLEGIIHERVVDDRFGELFAELEPYAATLPHDSDDAALVRVAQRDWDRARRVPKELAVEFAEVSAQSYEAWVKAREESDFAAFRPWLERILELRRRYVECFAPYDDPYDVLLQDYEWGMRTAEIREIFAVLAPELRELVAAHCQRGRGRVHARPVPHPAAGGALTGARRAVRGDVGAVPPRHDRPSVRDHVRPRRRPADEPLRGGRPPLTLHRDARVRPRPLRVGRQPDARAHPALRRRVRDAARVAEQALGERRRPVAPVLGVVLPTGAGDVPGPTRKRLSRGLPSSGEPGATLAHPGRRRRASYGLHVILRFELEQRLLSGELEVKDLPDAWNTRFEELVGVPVPSDALGVLQDAHWSGGGFGYFPTYLLGTVLSVQIWEKAREALPDVEEQIGRGEFQPLHEWLRENIYALGRKLTPAETVEHVVGGPIDPQPYLAYLHDKLEAPAPA